MQRVPLWRLHAPRVFARTISSTSSTALRKTPAAYLSTPWFVDETDEPRSATSGISKPEEDELGLVSSLSPPPPATAPAPLHALHSHLRSLPIIHSVSVLEATAFHNLRTSNGADLPAQRPHGKRRRGGSNVGGVGVEDPPPAWDWVLQAEVKDGAEKRGAVNAVLRSSIGKVWIFKLSHDPVLSVY